MIITYVSYSNYKKFKYNLWYGIEHVKKEISTIFDKD